MVKKFQNFENKIQKLIQRQIKIYHPTKKISLKTDQELMNIYIKSLIQSMRGENLAV